MLEDQINSQHSATDRESLLGQLSYILREMARIDMRQDGLNPGVPNLGYDAFTHGPTSAGFSTTDPFLSDVSGTAAKATGSPGVSVGDVITTDGVSMPGVTSASSDSATHKMTSTSVPSAQEVTTAGSISSSQVVTLELTSSAGGAASESSGSTQAEEATTLSDLLVHELTSAPPQVVSETMTPVPASISPYVMEVDGKTNAATDVTEASTAQNSDVSTQLTKNEDTTVRVAIGNDSTPSSPYLAGNGTDQSTNVQSMAS